MTYEIFRKWNVSKTDVPNMGGFVERQSEKYNATPGDSAFVIKALNQKKTATLAELANNFAFFDSYVGRSVMSLGSVNKSIVLRTPGSHQSKPSVCNLGLVLWLCGQYGPICGVLEQRHGNELRSLYLRGSK